jgi:glutamyl-Q tRNA(Asp) synthetase
LFQHQRHTAYQTALYGLIAKGRAYPCSCSRKRLQSAVDYGKTTHNPDGEILYPGFCRPTQLKSQPLQEAIEWFREFEQPGTCWRYFNDNRDDFILRRADGFWAYHHAVVVDDAYQQITHILRGDDLVHAMPRHAALRNTLGLPDPITMHIPVVRNDLGEKLSKQSLAPAVRTDHPEICRLQLECAWSHLELHMPIGWIARMRAPFERQLIEPLKRLAS